MPELPEVETIVNALKKVLPGLKIQDVWSDFFDAKKIKKETVSREILKVERRGKNILIHLSHGRIILIHQKMTGHLLYGKWKIESRKLVSLMPGPLQDDPENRFIHLIFFLSNGMQLALCDMRKFAKVMVLATEKIYEELKKLGPDPFDKDFTFKNFIEALPKKGKIKTILMNQEIISGIGNIYSDEILWEAGIHPLKNTEKLTDENLKRIFNAIKKILSRAIDAKGDSVSDFRRPSGEKGGYQKIQNAYQLTGTKCQKRDGGIIQKIKIGGRSAHFCPVHQRL